MQIKKTVGVAAVLVSTAVVLAGCASSGSSSGSSSSPSTTEAALAATSATSFKRDFSSMAALKPLASKGTGNVTVILPDTVSSARYTEFDAPYLKEAFTAAGLTSSQFTVQNAQGSDATQLTDAQSAITAGSKVLVVDPLDAGVGAKIEEYAKQHSVKVIDYDRLTLGGTRAYYVSFDNVKVGELIGNGLVTCTKDWNVSKPAVIEMKGDPTDNNATLFAQGYDSVLNPLYSSGWTKVAEPAGTWDPPTAATEFAQAYTAHPNANAALVPNDENAAPIITYLKNHGIKEKAFPITGQDATLVGLQNILSGYQCGTAYKPIYLEAQAAAALAMYLRADVTPPAGLVNGSTMDTVSKVAVPSVLLKPEWVTTSNMNSTVIADKFVTAAQLCTSSFAAACKAAGIPTS
ncbi:sugar ABC transporter substrate-binding protein [Leifsonia poae]|uniref:sugar ABC transporter substrate-binding protein n=1 Tax=Leifsonia poae TaxID=110933 RepID=UPI001CBD8A13|nr:substrate-binding domain-containing protein [Leifsonia poae]